MEIIRHHFEAIDSTNSWAKRNAHAFSRQAMTLVTADYQTSGRGRFNRHWISPPGCNLYATFCFFIDKLDFTADKNFCLGNIPQVLALAAVQVLKNEGFEPRLKWPNDLLLGGKKVGGILCEVIQLDMTCVVLGIGLNINMPLSAIKEMTCSATSLLIESGRECNVEAILSALQRQFVEGLGVLFVEGFSHFLEEYRNAVAMPKNQILSFHVAGAEKCEGYFDSITSDGTLNLRLASGQVRRFVSGEIISVRERDCRLKAYGRKANQAPKERHM